LISGQTVLVVAPDDELRRSIAFALEAEGFSVSTHRLLSPALKRASNDRFDCAVIDENTIGRRDGWNALSGIPCPIVLLLDRLRLAPDQIRVTPLFKPLLGRILVDTVTDCVARQAHAHT
jgi:DNA-binding response OmpR family regulator